MSTCLYTIAKSNWIFVWTDYAGQMRQAGRPFEFSMVISQYNGNSIVEKWKNETNIKKYGF